MMKDLTLSFIGAQMVLYSDDKITEREFLQNTLDLCNERLATLSQEDDSPTLSIARTVLAELERKTDPNELAFEVELELDEPFEMPRISVI